MLVPAFFVSVFVERRFLRVLWAGEDARRVRRFSWRAHFASYPVLIAVWLVFVLGSPRRRWIVAAPSARRAQSFLASARGSG